MVGLSAKHKEALALLYEYPEFKALEAWNRYKQAKCAEHIMNVDMGAPGATERVSMLQGQAKAHELMLLELKKIHKDQTKTEN